MHISGGRVVLIFFDLLFFCGVLILALVRARVAAVVPRAFPPAAFSRINSVSALRVCAELEFTVKWTRKALRAQAC